jgi:hypothetical protein
MAATASQSNLSGLPRRLVQDGIVTEEAVQDASKAAQKAKTPLVAYLVANELADPRAVAVAASHEFGVPLLDLDAIEIELECLRAVDQKLLNKHRVLPLIKRGQRLFLGIADPTNLQAIDDVKFQTSLRIDPVVVEQDKLEERIAKALEAVDTSMSSLENDDFDLENLDVSGDDEEQEDITRDDIEDATLRKAVSCSYPAGRRSVRGCSTAGCAGKQGLRTTQGHVADGYRRAARTAGRSHQDALIEESCHRFSRQHLPHALWRKDRAAYSRSEQREARHRRPRLRRRPESDVPETPGQAVRHDPGHRTDRFW